MKNYKIFFAIPFDCESRGIHEDFVIPSLREAYPEKLICLIGDKRIGWSGKYDAIESFKMQNSDLYKHFVKQIREADIIIADLTDNNPNVHVELGIALSYNKNILRVTRQSYERLSFDVRNYKVEQYRTKEDLLNTIKEYLELFFTIKRLDFQNNKQELSKLYYFQPSGKQFLSYWNNTGKKQELIKELSSASPKVIQLQHVDSGFHMRDGKVQVTFEIKDERDDEDWFGVYLRVGSVGFLNESILVYVRKRGDIEIVTYPRTEEKEEEKYRKKLSGKCVGAKILTIELDGDYIKASVDGIELERGGLNIQSPGKVMFASWFCNAEFSDAKIVCRDTIETFDSFS